MEALHLVGSLSSSALAASLGSFASYFTASLLKPAANLYVGVESFIDESTVTPEG